jgi:DNA repair exonuclease SbcCD ATPase subunit
VVAPDA